MKSGSTKEKVYNLLKENQNTYISGQEIADKLFITRAGIWKAIKSLREDGYEIEAVNNKGYCLVSDTESISKTHISENITFTDDLEIIVCDELDSTNNYAREMASYGYENNCVIITDSQTNGRGRRGRSFFSPKGTGIYMSFLLRPLMDISKATLLTSMTAVAVCRAIKESCDIDPSIKWVNDIFINGKKVSGILTEGFTSIEDGSLSYIIVGIGVNVVEPKDGFPIDIRKIAGSIYKKSAPENIRNILCANIINCFMNLYTTFDLSFVEEYRNRSNLIGHYVKVNPSDNASSLNGYAYVEGIDDECHLIVKYENGKTETLSNGEVSVVKY